MNAQEAKRQVKAAVCALPGVLGVGVGLLRDQRVGIIVQVTGERQGVIEMIGRNFPGGYITQFPIEVSRQGVLVPANQHR